MYGHICQASAHRGTADEPVVTGFFGTDVPQVGRSAMNHKLSLRGLALVKCNYKRRRPYTFRGGTVPCDGNTPIAQGRHGWIILGGNTPSRKASKRISASRNEILTVGTKNEGVSTNPLDSRHAREGVRYRQRAAFGTLTGWSFTDTDLGHPAGDLGPLPRDQ